jgi:hypothetical protein
MANGSLFGEYCDLRVLRRWMWVAGGSSALLVLPYVLGDGPSFPVGFTVFAMAFLTGTAGVFGLAMAELMPSRFQPVTRACLFSLIAWGGLLVAGQFAGGLVLDLRMDHWLRGGETIAAGIERYREANGRYPESLADLPDPPDPPPVGSVTYSGQAHGFHLEVTRTTGILSGDTWTWRQDSKSWERERWD